MMLIELLVIHAIPNNFLQLLIGGVVGVIFYMTGAFLLKFDELQDVKYMLNRNKY